MTPHCITYLLLWYFRKQKFPREEQVADSDGRFRRKAAFENQEDEDDNDESDEVEDEDDEDDEDEEVYFIGLVQDCGITVLH